MRKLRPFSLVEKKESIEKLRVILFTRKKNFLYVYILKQQSTNVEICHPKTWRFSGTDLTSTSRVYILHVWRTHKFFFYNQYPIYLKWKVHA